jgi:ketosteroid isomerase-like protein
MMQGTTPNELQIRALIDERVKAVRDKDARAAVAAIAPGIVIFDVVNPLRRIGSEENEQRAQDWFASFKGPIGFEIRDLSITAGDDVAFSHALHRYSGTTTDGTKIGMWVRATACYRKLDGTWTIVHEHQSVPFDPRTGAAALDLNP